MSTSLIVSHSHHSDVLEKASKDVWWEIAIKKIKKVWSLLGFSQTEDLMLLWQDPNNIMRMATKSTQTNWIPMIRNVGKLKKLDVSKTNLHKSGWLMSKQDIHKKILIKSGRREVTPRKNKPRQKMVVISSRFGRNGKVSTTNTRSKWVSVIYSTCISDVKLMLSCPNLIWSHSWLCSGIEFCLFVCLNSWSRWPQSHLLFWN